MSRIRVPLLTLTCQLRKLEGTEGQYWLVGVAERELLVSQGSAARRS